MTDTAGAPHRVETGVPNLDRILGGGILRGSALMVIGAPGTGKTILAQQVAFHAAARGGAALFLTGYSETHDKLLAYSRGLRFFAPEHIGREIHFGSLPDLLRQGAQETEEAIVEMARAHRATLVVIDGFRGLRTILADEHAAAHLLYSLTAKLALLGATTLVVVEGDPEAAATYPELTTVDAILALRRERRAGRQWRLLEALKVRGAAPLEGSHSYTIDADGISVFPRLESVVPATDPAWIEGRAGVGFVDVDRLLGGGLTVGTTTLMAGNPGMGKTLLGLSFLAAGVPLGEPGLLVGFMESVAQLREKARAFGLDLAAAEAAGAIRLLVLPSYNLDADRIAALLREDIERRGVRRMVIDSAAELERGIGEVERVPDFFAALVSYLRGRAVTSYLTLDLPLIVGPALEFAGTPLSVVAENLLLLRNVEYRGRLHRVFSALKMRFSDHDRAIHEYAIVAGHGIQILGPAPLGEGLLTGIARPLAAQLDVDPPESGEGTDRPWPRS